MKETPIEKQARLDREAAEKKEWEGLTDEQRLVYSDLAFRAGQFQLQQYTRFVATDQKGETTVFQRMKDDAIKLTAKLAREWADKVDPQDRGSASTDNGHSK